MSYLFDLINSFQNLSVFLNVCFQKMNGMWQFSSFSKVFQANFSSFISIFMLLTKLLFLHAKI